MSSESECEPHQNNNVGRFLRRVLPQVELILSQNETVDIFSSDKTSENRNLIPSSSKGNEKLKEIRNFTDLTFGKGKLITCIDWMSDSNGTILIGVSLCDDLSFDDRLLFRNLKCDDDDGDDECDKETAANNRISNTKPSKPNQSSQYHHIIVWNFAQEWIHPMYILQSPLECTTFKFHPSSRRIVGGLLNGQVILWDLEERSVSSSDEGGKYQMIKPIMMSVSEYSHTRYVSDLQWIGSQINSKGHTLANSTSEINQFITCSGDGTILFWDIRFREICEGKLPQIAKVNKNVGDKKHDQHEDAIYWVPLFKIKAKRLLGASGGSGEISPCRMNYCHEYQKNELILSSEEGDLLCLNWSLDDTKDNTNNSEENEKTSAQQEYTKWIHTTNTNTPIKFLTRSPFFPNIIAILSDKHFHLWNISKKPGIFYTSPRISTPHSITCGQWSPTYPNLLFIGKSDGYIDIWDFNQTCYTPTQTLLSSPNPITYMQFELTGKLAVGDSIGSLHIFEIPEESFGNSGGREYNKTKMERFIQNEMRWYETTEVLSFDNRNTENQQEEESSSTSLNNNKDSTEEIVKQVQDENKEEEEDSYEKFEMECLESLGVVKDSSNE